MWEMIIKIMFEPSVACIEKIRLKGRFVQNKKITRSEWKYEHQNNHDAKSWLETKRLYPYCRYTSFFICQKKEKKFNSLSKNLCGLPGVGKGITTYFLTFFVPLC